MKRASRLLLSVISFLQAIVCSAESLSLNGLWENGLDRTYDRMVLVPGICRDPSAASPSALWYRRNVVLPEGDWTGAVLELKGARFRPKVYVNGEPVSSSEGGMSVTWHQLDHPAVRPGATVTLEIELCSLKDVPKTDASFIPEVDQWRSNCSSCLWDDVILHLHSGARIDRLLVSYDCRRGRASLRYRVRGTAASRAEVILHSSDGKPAAILEGSASEGENTVSLDCRSCGMGEWSPSSAACYRTVVRLLDSDGKELSEYVQTVGFRTFSVKDKHFLLNGKPFRAKGGSVCWHRWVRDEDSREVAFDTAWFSSNILKRIKEHGGNYIRFHLGTPPERILDICDSLGLAVQYEWSFFHGMPASRESLSSQYSAWLDAASRHPSVAIVHPYNETEEKQLATVWEVLDSLLPQYPPMLVEDRDVLHIHRYWWGMSENVGLYYDSYRQFVKPIMVDEFGGVYLDRNGDMGGYPMVPKGMNRFLGFNHTASDRLRQQEYASGKIGEYWRRLGAAGVGVFPIASSFEDGNNWFLGNLSEGNPKPVWDWMTVVWADKAVSMDVWNRNFVPGQSVEIPLHFFNDSGRKSVLRTCVSLTDTSGRVVFSDTLSRNVGAYSSEVVNTRVNMPLLTGRYRLQALLLNPDPQIRHPVFSAWDINVLKAVVPQCLKDAEVYVGKEDRELKKMLEEYGISLVKDAAAADLVVIGDYGTKASDKYSSLIESSLFSGRSVVLLGVGNGTLGRSYVDGARNLGQISGAPKLSVSDKVTVEIFPGLSVESEEMSEPESHIHPSSSDSSLWRGLDRESTRLWNGLRGGIIVPAASMNPAGLSNEAALSEWVAKGADPDRIRSGEPYYAYEYCGFCRFDTVGDNPLTIKSLKDQVTFLIEDMPALELSLPVHTPVKVTDLSDAFHRSSHSRATSLVPLCSAGKNLVRTPVAMIRFGRQDGVLVLSQLLTGGRLARGYAPHRKVRPLEYDEAAVQMTLNMLGKALKSKEQQ